VRSHPVIEGAGSNPAPGAAVIFFLKHKNNMDKKNEKSTAAFRRAIEKHLEDLAQSDPLFYVTYHKEGKNLDDCITFILNTVQKSGQQGFTDEEVYSMAVHYYDEDKIDIGKPMDCFVVVNHKVELTEQEKEEARQQAIREVVEAEKTRMTQRPKTEAKKPEAKKEEVKEGKYEQAELF